MGEDWVGMFPCNPPCSPEVPSLFQRSWTPSAPIYFPWHLQVVVLKHQLKDFRKEVFLSVYQQPQMRRKKTDFSKVFQNPCPIQTDMYSFLASVSPRSQLRLAQTSPTESPTASFLHWAKQRAEADLCRNFPTEHFSNSKILIKTWYILGEAPDFGISHCKFKYFDLVSIS